MKNYSSCLCLCRFCGEVREDQLTRLRIPGQGSRWPHVLLTLEAGLVGDALCRAKCRERKKGGREEVISIKPCRGGKILSGP